MRYILLLSITWLFSQPAFAQTDSTQEENKKATLTLGALYSNNADYYGQKAEEKMPYVAASATFKLRNGIYFSGAGYKLLNDSGNIVSAGSAGAGIAFNLGKKLSADLGYSHTFFPANSPFLQASSPDIISGSLNYEYWMTTGVNVDYALGRQQDLFVTLSTEKLISLGHLFSQKDLVTLTPAIQVTGGTQHFYETYITEKNLRDSLLGILLPPLGNNPAPASTTAVTTSFDLLSYNLRLPLAYNRAHYMIEAAYQLSILGKKAASGVGTSNSFINFSIYYQF
jgi:hypothetical protein